MTDEVPLATFLQTRAQLHEYMTSGLYASSQYRRSPVDVDALVYVKLGGKELSAGDTEPLEEFIANLRKEAASAPDGAEVIIRMDSGYGSDDERGDPEYEVGYWREPTAKERAAREEQNRVIAENNRLYDERKADAERAEFERLKAKFDSDSDTHR